MIEISVIIPVYNGQAHIAEMIDSVINSSFTNFELILIDDGSTDNSESICKLYESMDSRIKYYKKSNGGIASARNYGLKVAKGNYICFMDQDDYMKSDGLEKLYNNCIKYDCDFCSSNHYYWDGQRRVEHILIQKDQLLNRNNCQNLCKWIICGNHLKYFEGKITVSGAVWTYLFKRKFLLDNNLVFIKYVDYEDDLVFLANAFKSASKVYLMKDCFYSWRYGHESESRRIKYIDDFCRKRMNYREYIVNTLTEVCNNEKEYINFLNYYDGYTVWKLIENEFINGNSILDNSVRKQIREVVSLTLNENNAQDVLDCFFGYKNKIIKNAYAGRFVISWEIVRLKMVCVKLYRCLQHNKLFMKFHRDIEKI